MSYIMNMFMFTMLTSLFIMILSLFSIIINSSIMMKFTLININNLSISTNMIMDWMSLLFLSTVMMISSLIILFSIYYIPKKEQKQFLILLMMFVTSMSILILSNNLFMILLGWDGLGLSSYILVIYYQNFLSAASGTITLLSNRVGDILILLSMGMIMLSSNWSFNMNMEYSTLTLMFLLIAACSKSAQFPFSAWLPMAMAAPTPISALVHSSTLVTAGVFLMLRLSTWYHPITNMVLLIISSSTAIYASMSANWEQDLKKIIALSTLSQIAMMMFAISLGSILLAYLHLIIHALFKSAMFLCAGNMIHESSYQDMRMMGLNFINHPITLSILGLNKMALMGIPFMSGFFSKDAIIENMMSSNMNFMLSMLMIMSIGMTASYSLRMSISSNKSVIKNYPFMSNHQSMFSMFPIISLSLFGITSGSWTTWLLLSEQMFPLSNFYKNTIMIMLFTGMMTGLLLQFKNNMYMKMGLSSISLWFTHLLTTTPNIVTFPLMKKYQNNDMTWQENYGPNMSFNLMKINSTFNYKPKSSTLMILIMLSIIPLFML